MWYDRLAYRQGPPATVGPQGGPCGSACQAQERPGDPEIARAAWTRHPHHPPPGLVGARGRGLAHAIEDLNVVLRGWAAYFKLTETKQALGEIDGWIRRKLRCMVWRQWKRPWKRFKMLRKQGLSEERAALSAFNQRGPWFNAGASHLNQAFPKRYFEQFGLISTLNTLRRFGTVLT